METTALRQLLQSLCESSQWKYALFWKLKHESPMIFTWEDGYCNYPKPGESTEAASGGMYFNDRCEMIPSDWETSICHGTSEGYPIELAVADMSCLQYTLGEGVIGEVAFTRKHCWISSDSIFADELDSKSMFEYPNEWLLQFASGIKTVLLVPVLPHGVLQLGSLETVIQDTAVVTHLQDRFNMLQNNTGNVGFQTQFSLPSSSPLSVTNILAGAQEIKTIDDVKPDKTELLSPFGVGPEERVKYIQAETLGNASYKPIYGSPEPVDSELFAMSCFEDLQAFPLCNVSATYSKIVNSYVDERVEELPFSDMDLNIADYHNSISFPSFPVDSELHKPFGPAFPRQNNEYLWDSFLSVDDTSNIADSICNRTLIEETEPSLFPEGSNPCNLLEAKVDIVSSSLNGTSSKSPDSVRLHSSQHQRRSEAAYGEESASRSLGSMISTLINDDLQYRNPRGMQARKSDKPSNASKRRVRSSENPKPRPRDRQMIQDRVKELRELVPDGSKCSIDGLLDKAINHMLFLRNVTDRAKKLKQHEVAEPRRSQETSNGYQNGTSWAVEFDSETQMCPILVEDLENQGHMLIEMLCDDLGVFLEISQVIRGLELTIVKGSLQTHSNHSWAHFIVEASRGFHRMDIFWPLMQFLQRKKNPISSKI